MKTYANQKRTEIEFEVREKVYLKLQPYRLRSLAKRINRKLSPHYYGPYEIVEKISPVAYKLLLPTTSQVHPVFHIPLLKKCVSSKVVAQPLPVALTADCELQAQPAEVLSTKTNNKGELEVLIKWQDLPDFENSWEVAADIQQQFPSFHLEDKVDFEGGGVVRTSVNSEAVNGKVTLYAKVFVRKIRIKGMKKVQRVT